MIELTALALEALARVDAQPAVAPAGAFAEVLERCAGQADRRETEEEPQETAHAAPGTAVVVLLPQAASLTAPPCAPPPEAPETSPESSTEGERAMRSDEVVENARGRAELPADRDTEVLDGASSNAPSCAPADAFEGGSAEREGNAATSVRADASTHASAAADAPTKSPAGPPAPNGAAPPAPKADPPAPSADPIAWMRRGPASQVQAQTSARGGKERSGRRAKDAAPAHTISRAPAVDDARPQSSRARPADADAPPIDERRAPLQADALAMRELPADGSKPTVAPASRPRDAAPEDAGGRQAAAISAINRLTLASAEVVGHTRLAELGAVEVRARTTAGAVAVEVRATEPGAADLLRAAAKDLTTDLRAAAVPVWAVRVRHAPEEPTAAATGADPDETGGREERRARRRARRARFVL